MQRERHSGGCILTSIALASASKVYEGVRWLRERHIFSSPHTYEALSKECIMMEPTMLHNPTCDWTSGIVDRNDSSVFPLLHHALNLCFNRGTWECQIALESHRDNERLSEFSSDRYLVSTYCHVSIRIRPLDAVMRVSHLCIVEDRSKLVSNHSFDFPICVVEGTFGTLLENSGHPANWIAKNMFGRISHQSFFTFRGCTIESNSMASHHPGSRCVRELELGNEHRRLKACLDWCSSWKRQLSVSHYLMITYRHTRDPV